VLLLLLLLQMRRDDATGSQYSQNVLTSVRRS